MKKTITVFVLCLFGAIAGMAQNESASDLYQKGVSEIRKHNAWTDAGVALLEQAAKLEHSGAQIILGNYESQRGNYSKALYWFNKAAEKDEGEAYRDIGDLYYEGKGVTKDVKKALSYYEKAAALGDVGGMRLCGLHYLFGEGCEVDYYKAFDYFQKGAELGDRVSQYQLGTLYLTGCGCAEDKKLAKKWIKLAADQGLEDAIEILKTIK